MAHPAATATHDAAMPALLDQCRSHRRGVLVVEGSARSGRTTAVLHRLAALIDAGVDPEGVLLLAADAPASRRLRVAALSERPDLGATLRVTSPWALAYDLVRRRGTEVVRIGRARARSLLATAIRSLDDAALAALAPHGVTEGLIGEVMALAQAASDDDLDAAVRRAADLGCSSRWEAAGAAITAYRLALAAEGVHDGHRLITDAAAGIEEGVAAVDHVLADAVGAHRGAASATALLPALAGAATSVIVTTGPDDPLPPALAVDARITLPDAPIAGDREVVDCHHPSLEGEAVASLVSEEVGGGRAEHEIAVVARRPARLAAIARALGRSGVPTVNHAIAPSVDPHVRGLIALLRWAGGDDGALDLLLASPLADLTGDERHRLRGRARTTDDPPELADLRRTRDELARLATTLDVARLAHRAFALAAHHLVPIPGVAQDPADARGLDAITAFIDDLARQVDIDPALRLDAWVAGDPGGDDHPTSTRVAVDTPGTVHLLTPDQAVGHAWPVVLVAGAVEGELPRAGSGSRYLDRALLTGAAPSAADRRREALRADRRLFDDLQRRASARFVALAPREPGVLTSRFVVDWRRRPALLPGPTADPPTPLPPTSNGKPLHRDPSLRLSASQLDTYGSCPRRYLYEYPLRIRGDSNVWADLGTLLHDILEEFVGPEAGETDLSMDRLMALVDKHWRDDIAEYRPQREELRRDLVAMLEGWYEKEGSQIGHTIEVLRAERPFTITVGPHMVTGRIDRVDRADDGTGIRILDYKTSKNPKSKADMDDDLQLRMYHLAALRDDDLSALGPPSQLRLLFVRSMAARDQEITDDHEAVTEALVIEMADRILGEAFEPVAGDWCRYCTVKRLCPLFPEGRDIEATT